MTLEPENQGTKYNMPEKPGGKASRPQPITVELSSPLKTPISIPNQPELLKVCFPQKTAS
jgi:hypothetical protein